MLSELDAYVSDLLTPNDTLPSYTTIYSVKVIEHSCGSLVMASEVP